MPIAPENLIAPGSKPERVASGAVWAEGPVWLPERRAVRFSDIPGNRVLEFSEETGALEVYAADAEYPNGRALDRSGAVVQCSHGRRAIERDTGTTPGAVPAVQTLVDSYNGRRLNSPNDVVVKSDGTIWFSDPSYGIQKDTEGHPGREEYGDRYVFRFDPASGELTPAVIDVEVPNGLAFSPDESILYVSDTSLGTPAMDGGARLHGHAIHAYDVVDGRFARNGRVFAEVTPGVPDGFRLDAQGNLWSSSGDGVRVFSPDGTEILHIPVPETVSNVCFGGDDGRTLYMTATTSLYRIRTLVTGAVS
ncbi:SMP-30/gluconolactonase/LRE family protein [Arthrobacter jiangjiafuii]|uniref:SMP-30/gluconolactonase/LRE family protein n=1 Tax=Arthrobacter jiangjiafuii TaxID=2817475 RepID=A0A975M4T0_9MICC|nr:SMP-30/gluconolactonase/LRE family protein [Arthrobacter jiangjiafuii]MBP3042339.1 SMP-30/gluconolactonase/LRE family protein [Arthrobacter jiangjiafuii]QWC09907.1 SMP-30/gluconolactonase/LRE family protein [Arthrobacter jiangjiafuii]